MLVRRPNHRSLVVTLLPLLLLLGCPNTKDTAEMDGCETGPTPTLRIGTGEYEFVPLEDVNHELELVHGPQGGYHLLIGLEARFLDASELMAGTMSGSIDGVELAQSSPWLQLRCNGQTETLQSFGSFLIYDAEPEDLHRRATHIEVEVRDLAGNTASAEADVTIVDPYLE